MMCGRRRVSFARSRPEPVIAHHPRNAKPAPLSTTQVKALTTTQMSALDATDISDFTNTQIAALNSDVNRLAKTGDPAQQQALMAQALDEGWDDARFVRTLAARGAQQRP